LHRHTSRSIHDKLYSQRIEDWNPFLPHEMTSHEYTPNPSHDGKESRASTNATSENVILSVGAVAQQTSNSV